MLNLFTNWVEYIEKPLSYDDMKKKMRKLKVCYVIVGTIASLIAVVGAVIMLSVPFLNGKFVGLLSFTYGVGGAIGIDIWAHIQLAKYKILWEMNKRFDTNIEHELRRSEAQDL